MSNAARKARKRLDRWIREEGLDLPTGFQHPRREGIPYGRSKPWSINRDIAEMHRQMDTTRAIVEAAPDIWRGMVGR
ncbi:hypothetical protein NYQ35_15915 [Curtobacterium flaccumfaciens pv. flaccumfaciens]|uniref:hypothetical protein n=1 Tax=Curtobacterium flaccumfaciens TaxID=2035 RepID=UPI00217EC708|nr:hypothetical protein [Curtobacterium flaccumfaciens]MCS6570292.1 hypothetical protein [Curtobacterium flaccumfaciens pv. flaccumfaciens]MCS6585148.1 hypothetical protein [Curtobacterium flaccumfaciens pv. flaccumfaciens]